jgi:phage terminase large subunit GpA-like protein
VDVQDNRLAVSVWAWGVGETCMPVWHQELWGDPLQDEVWAQLDAVLESTWPVEGGGELRIVQLGLDTGGHATHEAYDWARERRGRGVLALKGSSRRGEQPIGKGKPQDVNRRGRLVKRGVTLYLVGTDTIKTTLYGRLRHNQPGTGGYVHLGAAADDEFLRQLTAERQAVRISKGFAVKEWIKRASDRNEALDCWVYAYAALQYVYRRMDRRTIWEQLKQQRALALPAAPGELPIGKRRRRSDGPAVEPEAAPVAATAPALADAAAPRPRRRRASSWL